MKNLNHKISKILYLLLYGLITANFLTPLYLLLYLPSVVIWRLEGIRMENFFFDQVFFIQLVASLLLWLVSYITINSFKNFRQIFFATLVIINLSYIYALLPVLTTSQILPILWIPELVLVFFSLILAQVWEKVWQKKKIGYPWLLLLPFLASLLLVLKESPGTGNGLIFKTYLAWGVFLKRITGGCMNLFFLDFTGFAILLLNFLNTLIVLPLLFTPRSSSKNK